MTTKELLLARDMCVRFNTFGWRVMIIGGWVRDTVRGLNPKDLDLEVYGCQDPDELQLALTHYGQVDLTGRQFGVFKVTVDGVGVIDVSMPRTDSQTGDGHPDIVVKHTPRLTVREAAARRDYTINSMSMDPLVGKIHDPYFGQLDLEAGILRHTSPAFKDDPLRPLRGFRQAGQLNLIATADLVDICRSMRPTYRHLPMSRIWGEWEMWARRSIVPSMGLDFLRQTHYVQEYPALAALIGCQQELDHHPEGDAYEHTKYTVDAMRNICENDGIFGEDRVVLVLAALCHDLGKPTTSKWMAKDGQDWLWMDGPGNIWSKDHARIFIRPGGATYDAWASYYQENKQITSHGHDDVGVPIAEEFLQSIGCPARIIERVLPLVQEHMFHVTLGKEPKIGYKGVRRLAVRLFPANINEWELVVEADMNGRPPKDATMPLVVEKIVQLAEEIAITAAPPEQIFKGRHLLVLGLSPGKHIGVILDAAFEAQLDGEFIDLEGAHLWYRLREARSLAKLKEVSK